MSRHILHGSIVFIVSLACGSGLAAAQDPPQSPAPPVPSAAPASPAALNGIWKFNKELSSDTSKLQTEADNAAANGDGGGRSRGGGGGGGGFGGFGGRGG